MLRRHFQTWFAGGLLSCCGWAMPAFGHAAVFDAPASTAVQPSTKSAEERAAELLPLAQIPNSDNVRRLSAALADDSEFVRQAAAAALSQCGAAAEPAMPALTRALADVHARVRWGAAVSLGRIGLGAASSEPALVAAIRDRDDEVRCAALAALRSVPISDFDALESALLSNLSHPNADVRDECVASLAMLWKWCDANQLERLSLALAKRLGDDEPRLRLAAASLLGELRLGMVPAIPALAGGVNDADPAAQAAIVRALELFTDEVDQEWNSLNADQRDGLKIACEIAERLLADSQDAVPQAAATTVRFQKLLAGIRMANRETVVTADLQSNIDDSELAAPIEPNRISGAESDELAKPVSTSTAAIWIVFSILAVGGATWLTRWQLARRNSTTSEFAAPATSTPEPVTERIALSAETDLIDAHVVPAVMVSLPSAGAPDEAESVVRRMDVPEPIDQEMVARLLSGLQSQQARERADSAYRLAGFGPRAVSALPALRRALLDADPSVRCRAAFAVGQMDAAAAAAVAELCLLVFDRVTAVRRHAASALGGIGPHAAAALPELARVIADPDAAVRRSAVTALGLIDLVAAESVLRTALADPDGDVRVAAQAALDSLDQTARSTKSTVVALKVFRPSDANDVRGRSSESLARAA